MDIQTFSTTYWYIWFLAILLIVTLFILNGIGLLLYRKNRQKFLDQSNQLNDNIPMCEASTISTINVNQSKYRHMSIPSTITSDPSLTRTTHCHSSYVTNSIPNKTKLPSIQSESISIDMDDKSDIDLSLEEFQRQALQKHNSVRAMYYKPSLKLSQSLNSYAQYWAERCAQTNNVVPSQSEWRLQCKGQPLGENIISVTCIDPFDGMHFTSLIMANGNQSNEVDCVLNELSTEVGFGRACTQPKDDTQQPQWIGVAHYYPYRQLTSVQS